MVNSRFPPKTFTTSTTSDDDGAIVDAADEGPVAKRNF